MRKKCREVQVELSTILYIHLFFRFFSSFLCNVHSVLSALMIGCLKKYLIPSIHRTYICIVYCISTFKFG